jgi:hypothetical protein
MARDDKRVEHRIGQGSGLTILTCRAEPRSPREILHQLAGQLVASHSNPLVPTDDRAVNPNR